MKNLVSFPVILFLFISSNQSRDQLALVSLDILEYKGEYEREGVKKVKGSKCYVSSGWKERTMRY